MTDERRKTTDSEFERFTDACRYWIEYYGLIDWSVVYEHRSLDNDPPEVSSTLANISGMEDSREAIISFTDEYYHHVLTPRTIEETAYHEVCELLLMEFWFLATRRFDVNYDEMTGACHRVIHRLVNTTFKEYWDKKLIEPSGFWEIDHG